MPDSPQPNRFKAIKEAITAIAAAALLVLVLNNIPGLPELATKALPNYMSLDPVAGSFLGSILFKSCSMILAGALIVTFLTRKLTSWHSCLFLSTLWALACTPFIVFAIFAVQNDAVLPKVIESPYRGQTVEITGENLVFIEIDSCHIYLSKDFARNQGWKIPGDLPEVITK